MATGTYSKQLVAEKAITAKAIFIKEKEDWERLWDNAKKQSEYAVILNQSQHSRNVERVRRAGNIQLLAETADGETVTLSDEDVALLFA